MHSTSSIQEFPVADVLSAQVTCKGDATPEQVKQYAGSQSSPRAVRLKLTTGPSHRAKDQATSQGGTIGHDYNLIKGFS